MEDSSSFMLGALIFVLIIVGVNFAMYAIVRGAIRNGGEKSILENFSKSLTASSKSKDNSMDELRQKIKELNEGKKDAPADSEK
ncbi:MAG: hypothetical protein FJ031_07290 [Chloroflexi bacterium]|nr:hypothetical protein [Chloroflexota bacterium]